VRDEHENYGQIDIKQLQQETDNGHVSQRRTWVYSVPQVPLRFLDLLLSN
jgi:hypothetical protein